FPLHPDVAHYCAWFCPGEKGFLDHRFALFTRVAPEYEPVCRALLAAGPGEPAGWRKVLRDRGAAALVLYDPDPARLFPALRKLALAPQEWGPPHVDGRAVVFVAAGARARPALDLQRLAFGHGHDWELPRAPGRGPGRAPEARGRWASWWRPAGNPTWEA